MKRVWQSMRAKDECAFAIRWHAMEQIDFPTIRAHRLAQVEEEERNWLDRLQSQAQITLEMAPLIIVHLEGGTPGG